MHPSITTSEELFHGPYQHHTKNYGMVQAQYQGCNVMLIQDEQKDMDF